MRPAVEVERLSKRFHRVSRSPLRRIVSGLRGQSVSARKTESGFWAVQNVSFCVAPGEVLGIIGPNGAGKSTILKLLAGILRPTEGAIAYRGRMSALIELGAGFHPELTGRENVRLNAAILGVPQARIRSRIDEVAEFADLRDFMEMPVKHYSSGMTARLGFSIAAHVEPEILLVDEVLSVGDRVFRGRCIDRMNSFLRRGATIVFVSHDLQTVHSFCGRVLLLDRGRAAYIGAPTEAIARYQRQTDAASCGVAEADAALVVEYARIVDENGIQRFEAASGEWFTLEAELSVRFGDTAATLVVVRRSDELIVGRIRINGEGRTFRVQVKMRANLLPGEYEFGFEAAGERLAGRVATAGGAPRLMVLGCNQASGVVDVRPRIEVVAATSARTT